MSQPRAVLAIGLLWSLVVMGCVDSDGAALYAGVGDTISLDLAGGELLAGGEHDPLHDVTGAALLGDTIIIVDGSSATIRWYDSRDGSVGTVGGEGEGPGEFRSIDWVQRVGDRVVAWDGSLGRLSEFTAAGNLVGTTSLEVVDPYVDVAAVGVFSDGSILGQARSQTLPASDDGVYRTPFVLQRFASDGQYVDSLGWYEGTEMFAGRTEMGNVVMALEFGRQSAVKVWGDQYYVMDNNGPAIRVFELTGQPAGRIEVPGGPADRDIAAADWNWVRNRWIEQGTIPGIDYGAFFDEIYGGLIEPRERLPYFGWADRARPLSPLRIDNRGRLWVLLYGGVGDARRAWTVLDDKGIVYAQVMADGEIDVLEAADDWLVTLHWDEFDAETVHMVPVDW